MNTTNLLSPAVLKALAFIIVSSSALMVAVQTSLLALAVRRAPTHSARNFVVPILAGILLAAWFGWAILAVNEKIVAPEPPPHGIVQNPALLIEMGVFVIAGIAVLFTSKTMRALNAAMPPAWLIAVQTYRVEGVIFLWLYFASGALPAGFALPAGIGDTLTGLAAPFVAWGVARNLPGSRERAVMWNLFGILDLVVAPMAAVLTHSTNIGRFPLDIVPLFLGPPIGILTHIYSLRNLSQNGREAVAAPSVPECAVDALA
jgi:hypothetical protein